ncbi:MAG: class I SAM-dependent methyltransferase [Nitrospira sp.]|nr:class I SAM-dependent methyltransferase [Nitrospira sp.]
MNQVFSQIYADAYDLIYRDKNYDQECELLDQVFSKYATVPIRKVLDLGCGTGNHALRLATKGYEVVGVDYSSDMLRVAERKAQEKKGISLRLHRSDIRDLNLKETFDVVLLMFAVLGYQLENLDVLSALQTAKRHLHPSGLLVFDVWYGPAVLTQRPGDRIRIIETEQSTLLRTSSGTLDVRRQICVVQFHLWHIQGDRILRKTEESHPMRFFFPRELEFFLEASNFQLLRLGAFPDFDRNPDETTWNVMGVARPHQR